MGHLMKLRLLMVGGLLLAACGDEPVPAADPTLTNVQTLVFAPSCNFSSCHGGPAPQAGLNLTGMTHGVLVNVPSTEKPSAMRVVPGNPDASFLMDKLLNRNLPTSTTANWTSMPPSDTLDAERLELVRAWISGGAPNN